MTCTKVHFSYFTIITVRYNRNLNYTIKVRCHYVHCLLLKEEEGERKKSCLSFMVAGQSPFPVGGVAVFL